MPSGVLNRAPPDAASGWWSYDAKERRINELERENAGLKAKVGSLELVDAAPLASYDHQPEAASGGALFKTPEGMIGER